MISNTKVANIDNVFVGIILYLLTICSISSVYFDFSFKVYIESISFIIHSNQNN